MLAENERPEVGHGGGWLSDSLAAQTEHECIDMAEVAAALNVSNPIHGKTHQTKRGKCRYEGCTITTSRGRAKYRCGACGDGKGWFYHLPCFMATHRITKK